ncbi:MAG TPA: PP2C family protein-serine/threonine phosphatase [Solirubrobacteraceae bacterium]|nr:PP2C family protein-serine/threonine phosphatase [Solirubrobacteraceae bacterium]
MAIVAFFLGLVVTAGFALTSLRLYDRNESRLLRLRAREVSSVLTAVVPSIQTPLASAAELADATGGDRRRFQLFMAPYVGPGRQFASASLWRLGTSRPAPTAVVGVAPTLASLPEQARRFFAHAERSQLLNITGVLSSPSPSLGFEFSTPGSTHGFAVYAENPLPRDRRSALARNSAFSDLNYAVYLGRTHSQAQLVVTSLHHFPIRGRQASQSVPFGDSAFTLVVTPNGPLGGTFFESLPWIIVAVGVVISLAAALMTDRLARRRQYAEQLTGVLDRVAAENHQMYTEQRGIAQTLQHALLPDALPEFSGLKVSARYIPAASGIDVGGDWYDVVAADDRRVLLVIGDVSGHGLHSATTMALLRHAALAYAAEECRPATVLAKLSDFVNSDDHDYFATVLCALIDVEAHSLTMASAGHIAPLLIDGGNGEYVKFKVNVPIGVVRKADYEETTVSVAPKSTLVAFTDGLVERRTEILDAGLARLRQTATGQRLAPEDLVETLTRGLASTDHNDDTAIVVIQWEN